MPIKPASQLKSNDVHSVHGAIRMLRKQNSRMYVKFTNGVSKIYKLVEHISVS